MAAGEALSLPDSLAEEVLVSPRAEKSDSLSDVEESHRVPREFDLYGTTPPSSRSSAKPSREKSRSQKRRKSGKEKASVNKSEFSYWVMKRRTSESFTTTERAQSRAMKLETSSPLFVNTSEDHFEIISGAERRQRSWSSTDSSQLSGKPLQRKYKTIRYREPVSGESTICLRGLYTSECPQKRVQFYDTLNVLMNLGQGANSEAKEKLEEEEEKFKVEEPKEALWLELQAWHNSTTMLDQDEYLMNVRTGIIGVLDSIIHFKVDYSCDYDDTSSDSESESDYEEECCLLHVDDSADDSQDASFTDEWLPIQFDTNDDQSTEPSNSENTKSPRLSLFARNVRQAIMQVTSILDKLDEAEQLYPSRGALSQEIEMYKSGKFNKSVDTLILWLNVIKGMYHKLHVMSKLVYVDLHDEKVWGDWIELGLGKYQA